MKRTIALAIACLVATSAMAQETIVLLGSNQNQTTLGFEMNEYDYLINPVYLHMLDGSWYFFALDNNVNQLAADIVGNGFRAGWAPGGARTPVLLANYLTNMNTLNSTTAADNVEVTRTGYDTATGTYATIGESVNEFPKQNRQVHNLVLHGGLGLTDTISLTLQLGLLVDRWTVQSVDYTNTYSNTAAPSDASLTSKGDLTQTDIAMNNASDNGYRLDLEAGLNIGSIQSKVVLGAGWYNPQAANSTYSQTVTVYNAFSGLDNTVRDQETTTAYTGQYTTAGGVPTPDFTMAGTAVNWAEFYRVGIDSSTVIPISDGTDLTIPLVVGMDLYPADLQTAQTSTIVSYDDSSTTGTEMSRDTTTTTTGLTRSLDLVAQTGAHLGKSVTPSDNTKLHLGAGLDVLFEPSKDSKTQMRQQVFQQDNDGDGLYTTAGTDVNYTYTETGYAVQSTVLNTTGTFKVETAVSYNPLPILTFHAGASAGLSVGVMSTSTLTTGDAGFVYETYTDNLDSANSYVQRQKDGSANNTIPSTMLSTSFTPFTDAQFGFTLDFNEGFRIDAKSVFGGNVGFSQFSVIGMYSY